MKAFSPVVYSRHKASFRDGDYKGKSKIIHGNLLCLGNSYKETISQLMISSGYPVILFGLYKYGSLSTAVATDNSNVRNDFDA